MIIVVSLVCSTECWSPSFVPILGYGPNLLFIFSVLNIPPILLIQKQIQNENYVASLYKNQATKLNNVCTIISKAIEFFTVRSLFSSWLLLNPWLLHVHQVWPSLEPAIKQMSLKWRDNFSRVDWAVFLKKVWCRTHHFLWFFYGEHEMANFPLLKVYQHRCHHPVYMILHKMEAWDIQLWFAQVIIWLSGEHNNFDYKCLEDSLAALTILCMSWWFRPCNHL